MSTLLLHTIPFSHYCDYARWSLQRANVDFEERASLPGLHLVNVSQVQWSHEVMNFRNNNPTSNSESAATNMRFLASTIQSAFGSIVLMLLFCGPEQFTENSLAQHLFFAPSC